MITEIGEPIKVGVVFGANCIGGKKTKPMWFIWKERQYRIKEVTYMWTNKEGRAYGVKVGMTVSEAKKLCPDIIFVAGNNKKYTDTCTRLVRLYADYTPLVEVYSVDEAFLDITGSLRNQRRRWCHGYLLLRLIRKKDTFLAGKVV